MKKLILAAVFTIIATLAQADPNLTFTKDYSKNDIRQESPILVNIPSYLANNQVICAKVSEKDVIQQRGCCSWHGGVCGCENGRVVCCDGEFSPSCTCHNDGKIEN